MKTRMRVNKLTRQFRMIGLSGVTSYFQSREDAIKDYKRLQINRNARERNEILSGLCGTSARAARADMGL